MKDVNMHAWWSRRGVLRLGAAAATALGVGRASQATAHNLPPHSFGSPAYERALAAQGAHRAVFQSPNIEAAALRGKHLDHLLLTQAKNWLNAFQFSYQAPPADLHIVVATYASANLLTYSDSLWQKYRLGEKYNVIDPETNAPAVRNVFWPSRFGASASNDPDNPQSFYQDTGIEALQKRGLVFLTWHQTLDGHARAAVADSRAPAGMTPADVVKDLAAHLIPQAVVIPAMVGEVSRLQQHGYSLVFVPTFRP